MIKKIFIAIIAIIVAFAVIVYLQPEEFNVSRSIKISSSADTIFPHINNLRQWDAWSPWAKLDPNAKNSFEGPDEGVGAIMHWVGNSDVGEGSMLITEIKQNEFIKFKLDFIAPMKATNTAEFTFTPAGDQTSVTWSMSGKNNFIGKAIGLIFNCEKMVGGQFEKGLASLKEIVEAEVKSN